MEKYYKKKEKRDDTIATAECAPAHESELKPLALAILNCLVTFLQEFHAIFFSFSDNWPSLCFAPRSATA